MSAAIDNQWVVEALATSGKSKSGLAKAMGVNPSAVTSLIKNERAIRVHELPRIVEFLGVSPPARAIGAPTEADRRKSHNDLGFYRPPPQLLGERSLLVFASAEGGPGEMNVFSSEPYEIVTRPWYVERDPEAFGIFLVGDSMEDKFEAGQILIVSPRAALVKGKAAVFIAEPNGGDFRASVKIFRGSTPNLWLAKQLNPEMDLEYDRAIWRKAYRVIGTYDG